MGRARLAWTAGLGLLGLGISAYLALTHYFAAQVPLACATGGVVDCELVTRSAESMIGPVPVSVLGLVWFGAFLALLLIGRQRRQPKLLLGQLAWSGVGLLSVFYLVYTELYVIGAMCVWCTAVHGIVAALFMISLWEATAPSASQRATA
jgi:uncharacterized membrane protein